MTLLNLGRHAQQMCGFHSKLYHTAKYNNHNACNNYRKTTKWHSLVHNRERPIQDLRPMSDVAMAISTDADVACLNHLAK